MSNELTRMPNSLCRGQPSFVVARVIEIEADTIRNLNIHLHRIEYREPIEIHSMVNISTCKSICWDISICWELKKIIQSMISLDLIYAKFRYFTT